MPGITPGSGSGGSGGSGSGGSGSSGDGRYGPDDPVTREQLAAILFRYAKYKGYDVSIGENTNILSYDDAFDISGYAIPAVQWACGTDVLDSGNTALIRPTTPATRGEIAHAIHRFLEDAAKQ